MARGLSPKGRTPRNPLLDGAQSSSYPRMESPGLITPSAMNDAWFQFQCLNLSISCGRYPIPTRSPSRYLFRLGCLLELKALWLDPATLSGSAACCSGSCRQTWNSVLGVCPYAICPTRTRCNGPYSVRSLAWVTLRELSESTGQMYWGGHEARIHGFYGGSLCTASR
jgi:hypothetical protein